MKTLNELINTLPQQGTLQWIGLRPERRTPMVAVTTIKVTPEAGLHGDRYQGRSGQRQVTLIQAEHLAVIASCLGLNAVSPALLRRNLVVHGINLNALKDKEILVGKVKLAVTGLCHPCSYMEQVLGAGGYNAMRGHGGITARVITSGEISIGDVVSYADTNSSTQPRLI